MQSAHSLNREEKKRKIGNLFGRLFCFTSDEIALYMERVELFPDDGLDKMIKLLEQGQIQQDGILERRISDDKNFTKDFGRFLKTTTTRIKNKWEKSESGKAEDILRDID